MLGVNTPALPASLRRTNQRTVISLLLRLGSASRADLAKAAGISQPTAGKITTELLRLGILQQAGTEAELECNHHEAPIPRLGRPGQLLRLDAKRRRFLAIELGVAETSIAALPVAVNLEDEWNWSFSTPKTPAGWVRALEKVAGEFSAESLWGVLISAPGIVDEVAGRVLYSPNLHWLEQANLPNLVKQVWDLPVCLVQEIRALALGQFTASPGGEDFFLVDFGQGVGGAVVLNGQIYSPPMPLSGEFGHTPVAGNRRLCGCGATGCLETLVSERGLLESFAEAGGGSNPTWKNLVNQVDKNGLEPWLVGTLNSAAQVIAGALNVLGLHRVIVTGRLTELPGCEEHLAKQIREGALWGRFGEVTTQNAPHRRAAGLVAAGLDRLVLPADEDKGLVTQQTQ